MFQQHEARVGKRDIKDGGILSQSLGWGWRDTETVGDRLKVGRKWGERQMNPEDFVVVVVLFYLSSL